MYLQLLLNKRIRECLDIKKKIRSKRSTMHSHWNSSNLRGHRGRDRMVVGFTTTCAICTYHHCCEFESRSWRGVLDTTLCDKNVSVTCDRSVVFSGFLHQ
jgi:hypothetical protein